MSPKVSLAHLTKYLAWLPVIAAFGFGAVVWGQTDEKIRRLETQVREQEASRERLVRVETQVDDIVKNQEELKDKVEKLDDTIQNGLRDVLVELRKRQS